MIDERAEEEKDEKSRGSTQSRKRSSKPTRQTTRIEKRLHDVHDVTLGEDASTIHAGRAPQVMAAIRNVTIAAARLVGFSNVAEALRFFAQLPYRAAALFLRMD